MSQNLMYVGIDVDDVRYHGCALEQHTGEQIELLKHQFGVSEVVFVGDRGILKAKGNEALSRVGAISAH